MLKCTSAIQLDSMLKVKAMTMIPSSCCFQRIFCIWPKH